MSSQSQIAARVNAAQLRAFGESIYYQSAGGTADPLDLTVIWSENDAQLPKGVRATIWTLESNFNPMPAKNDIVRRGDFEFRVVDPPGEICYVRDGNGGVTVYLRQTKHAADA